MLDALDEPLASFDPAPRGFNSARNSQAPLIEHGFIEPGNIVGFLAGNQLHGPQPPRSDVARCSLAEIANRTMGAF
jgi:hypothetical protein